MLSDEGYEVLCFDIRGHGNSEGVAGFFENKDILLEDISNFIKLTQTEYSKITQNSFIFGYSLGGLLANLIALQKADYFNGLVMISPPMDFDHEKYDKWIGVTRFLNKYFPKFGLISTKGKLLILILLYL